MPRGKYDRSLTKEQRAALKKQKKVVGGKVLGPAKSAAKKSAEPEVKNAVVGSGSLGTVAQLGHSYSLREDLVILQNWIGSLSSIRLSLSNQPGYHVPTPLEEEIVAAIKAGAQLRRLIFPVIEEKSAGLPAEAEEIGEEDEGEIGIAEQPAQASPVTTPAPAPLAAVTPAPAPAPAPILQQ